MSAEIEEYDRDTVAYLRGVGVQPAMLGRVERLAQEVADLKAAPKAIAGSDIKPGMTVILKPGGPLFAVYRIEPADTTDAFMFAYKANSDAPKAIWLNRWYVLAEES